MDTLPEFNANMDSMNFHIVHQLCYSLLKAFFLQKGF